MKAKSFLNAPESDGTNRSGRGAPANLPGDYSRAVFNLGLDISSLRPRQRIVVRALLQRMSGASLPAPAQPQG